MNGIWGANATILSKQEKWDCPDEIMEHTRRVVERIFSPVPVLVRTLDWVRDWKAWSASLGIEVVQGIQHRPKEKVVPHFWRFTKRQDLPVSLISAGQVDHRGPDGQPGQPMDVILEVKEYMTSETLSQPAVAVIAAGEVNKLALNPAGPWVKRRVVDETGVRKFAETFAGCFPRRQNAVDYLMAWSTRRGSTRGMQPPYCLQGLLMHRVAHTKPTTADTAQAHRHLPVGLVHFKRAHRQTQC